MFIGDQVVNGDLKNYLRTNEVHEKRAPGYLGYIGDEILPSYIGIIINHELPVFHEK